MPFDIVTIGLLHTGEKGNPVVYTSRLQEAFPGCNGLSLRRDRWIPVSERLPDHTNTVIVSDEHGVWFAYRDGKLGEWWDCDGPLEDITHWMPLPEPPCCTDGATPSGKTTPD